jgi:hypothetical protein
MHPKGEWLKRPVLVKEEEADMMRSAKYYRLVAMGLTVTVGALLGYVPSALARAAHETGGACCSYGIDCVEQQAGNVCCYHEALSAVPCSEEDKDYCFQDGCPSV